MPAFRPRPPHGLVPLLVLGGVVILVAFGFARGFWASNLHNGLLALAFSAVGAYVATRRPGHRLGRLFVLTGMVEGVLFFGRQVGHAPRTEADRWWAWLGVWPLALALALTTAAIICFPDGRLPSPRWRYVMIGVGVVASFTAALSAIWPVEYPSTGTVTVHPLNAVAPSAATDLWSAIARPSYVLFQLLWIVALAARWRGADREIRSQLGVILVAAVASLVALAVGLAAFGTHVPGVLAAAAVPVAAGWAIVHGRRLAAYRALSWLSRTSASSDALPGEIARTAAEALDADGATLWMGEADRLAAVGVWPETDRTIPAVTLGALEDAPGRAVRALIRDDRVIGALAVEGPAVGSFTRGDRRLLDDLAGQAGWVVEHLSIARLVNAWQRSGHLDDLTPREGEVLELMAQGLTNQAICDRLFLSIKTVEPIVSAIFAKLDLHPDAANNRRVLAVLAYVQHRA